MARLPMQAGSASSISTMQDLLAAEEGRFSMALNDAERKQIQDAINQVRADLTELEGHIPTWVNENVHGTKTYRPIAKQIVHSAQRLDEIVRKFTY
jgi:ABC-type Na+ transport system ATPase subunit NatA